MQILRAPLSWLRRIFKRRTTGVQEDSGATSVLNKELEKILESTTDSKTRKVAVRQELQPFLKLFDRYLYHSLNGYSLELAKITSPSEHQLVRYESIYQAEDANASLKKLAVLKVETCSDLVVLDGQNGGSFLDLTMQQISHLNSTYDADIPLILLKSLDSPGSQQTANVFTITQSKFPKIYKDADSPYKGLRNGDGGFDWCPVGNGDIYDALVRSGMLDRLLSQGKEILFVANVDNLGATVDPQLLMHMVATETEFMLEVVEKRRGEVKSDLLVSSSGQLTLLMENHVPPDRLDDFHFGFKHGNTGSLWINLSALKRVLKEGAMHLDIVAHTTSTSDNRTIIQLETSAESAIQYFKKALGVHVPRRRFLPVRTCSDLLLVKSNVFSLRHGQLCLNEDKVFNDLPVIKLGDRFQKVMQTNYTPASDLRERFKSIPNLVDLDHLTVVGDVYFGKGVVLRGSVIVIAQDGHQLYIPDNSVIENRLVSGSLTSTARRPDK